MAKKAVRTDPAWHWASRAVFFTDEIMSPLWTRQFHIAEKPHHGLPGRKFTVWCVSGRDICEVSISHSTWAYSFRPTSQRLSVISGNCPIGASAMLATGRLPRLAAGNWPSRAAQDRSGRNGKDQQ